MPYIKLTKASFANLTGQLPGKNFRGVSFVNGVSTKDLPLAVADKFAAQIEGTRLVQANGTDIGPAGSFYRKTTILPEQKSLFRTVLDLIHWDKKSYPIIPTWKDANGKRLRRGSAGAWSPFKTAAYRACKEGRQLYVSLTGNDTTGDGTQAKPLRTFNKAIQVANAGGTPATIRIAAGVYYRATGGTFTITPTVPLLILATGGQVVMGGIDTYTWAVDAANPSLYKVARSNLASVYNPRVLDRFGNATQYVQVATLAACLAKAGSVYTDNTSVWINPFDGAAISDSNARLFVKAAGFEFTFGANPQNFFVDGETESDGFDVQGCRIKIFASAYGATTNIVAMRRVASRYAGYANADVSNGFGFDNIRGLVWLEDCYCARPAGDAFNFHNNLKTGASFVVTVNCKAVDPGVFGVGSNNGLTLHSNIIGIDICGDYEYCQGGTLRNIDSTQFIGFGTRLAGDRGDLYITGGLVYPTEVGLLNTAVIYLIDAIIEAASPLNNAIDAPAGTKIFTRDSSIVGRVVGGPSAIAKF